MRHGLMAVMLLSQGITELRDMAMLDGRFKVFNTCEPFFEEFRLYHRDEKREDRQSLTTTFFSRSLCIHDAPLPQNDARHQNQREKIPAPIRPIARRT